MLNNMLGKNVFLRNQVYSAKTLYELQYRWWWWWWWWWWLWQARL